MSQARMVLLLHRIVRRDAVVRGADYVVASFTELPRSSFMTPRPSSVLLLPGR